ncbi:helix-loop-helix DNA-binding domain-containing protein [Cunninghamella echinulata]|nr:helix-loop-helix DNA-binding domain-containing protein [Cunninghamella echinulata]
MNISPFYDCQYQNFLHDENDYMLSWFQNPTMPKTPATLSNSSSPPQQQQDCFTANDMIFSTSSSSSSSSTSPPITNISPQPPFTDIYDMGSILIPSDDIITPTTSLSTGSSTTIHSFQTSPSPSSSSSSLSPASSCISNMMHFTHPISPIEETIKEEDEDDEDEYDCMTLNQSQQQPNLPFKKVAHNAIERRYRNNINDRIKELQQVVPALCRDVDNSDGSRSMDDDEDLIEEEEDGIPVARKLNKATILQKATEYIKYLKYSQQLLKQENEMLQRMIQALPNGEPLLEQFLMDKQKFDQAEKERRIKERKLALQQQRINHQRMLKERAAQRAAMMSPEERQRRRRRSSQTNKRKSSSSLSPCPSTCTSSTSSSSSPTKLLSVFLGLTFFTGSSTNQSSIVWRQHRNSKFMASSSVENNWSWSDYWPIVRFLFYCLLVTYLFILPFMTKIQFRRTGIKKRFN